MSTKQFQAEKLTEGSLVMVRGKINFARLTKVIEGEDLERANQTKVANGMSPVNTPHVTATLSEPQVLFADPANPTYEESFVAERFYVSKKNPDAGPLFNIDSKGNTPPTIAIPSPKGDGTYDQDTSQQELANGLDVTLVLRTYKPKTYNKRGLAIEHVVVNEPVRYYSGAGSATQALAARGIVFNSPPVTLPPSTQEVPAHPDDNQVAVPPNSQVQDGFVMPAPAPSEPAPAAPAPVQAQAPAQPAVDPAQDQVAALQAQLAALQAENQQIKDEGSAFGAPAPQGDAQANPWDDQAGRQSQPAGGITYQP